jgi:hypothetical protein
MPSCNPGPAFGRPECRLVSGIYVFLITVDEDVDGRDKPGHNEE